MAKVVILGQGRVLLQHPRGHGDHRLVLVVVCSNLGEVRDGVRTILIGRNYMVDGEGLAIGWSTVTWFFTMTF